MDDLVDFTSLGPENMTRLAKDFMRTSLIPCPTHPAWQVEKEYADKVSEVASRTGRSPTRLSSQDAAILAETFRKVSFHHKAFPHLLKPPVVRAWTTIPRARTTVTHGSDFMSTPSSVDHKSFPM